MTKIFIDGSEGTTGLRIRERLSERNDIELINIPNVLRKSDTKRRECIEESDITFLCLPDMAAREAVGFAENTNTRIIDASTAHRTEKGWAYGFPELSIKLRKLITESVRVAVPGCHASGFAALVYPLINLNILPKDYPIVCQSITGYSGGGKKMIEEYESDTRSSYLVSPRQYALTQEHKHLKEMQYISELKYAPIFNPIVADYYSGMEVIVPLYTRLLNGANTLKSINDAMSNYYKESTIVKVLPIESDEINSFAPSNYMSGYDSLIIKVSGNDERIVLTAIFDNLGKGASGAAIQCMNIMLGISEITGLII